MALQSTVTFRYEFTQAFQKKGIKHLIKEEIIDGAKGLFFKLLTKKGDVFYRIEAKEDENNKDKFLIKEKKGENETQKEVTLSELKKLLAADNLDFAKKYITKDRDTYKGRKHSISQTDSDDDDDYKKRSKKGSKKSSKKQNSIGGSKKRTKKSSKKSSKKQSSYVKLLQRGLIK